MNPTANPQPRFDFRTGQLIQRCLKICNYHADLVEKDYSLGTSQTVPLVTFAHRPHDARSSCMVFLPESPSARADASKLRELGAPVIFFAGATAWDMWSLRTTGPRREKTLKFDEVEPFFEAQKDDFSPNNVFRAKAWARVGEARQLDFVDSGFLPMIEAEAGQRIKALFEDMVVRTMDGLHWSSTPDAHDDQHWLIQANFWLLAGKLLKDKNVPKFTQLDLTDVEDVFGRVGRHYGSPPVKSNGRLKSLHSAAQIANSFSSLSNVSTETLGALYEEALLTPRIRKLLSVHRTPTYLVDYMLAKLNRWIEKDVGINNCRVFEPACGHAPFLVGTLRLLSNILPKEVAIDRAARRQFLRQRLRGCDKDSFALEIARLCLTLADVPNHNGWKLDAGLDMYDGDYLKQNIASHSIILANPPFEQANISSEERSAGDLRYARSGQAGELLRRIINHSSAGTVFGIVVPQTILEGTSFKQLRRSLLTEVEINEIFTFPDSVFKFANPETALILGRKLPQHASAFSGFQFRRISRAKISAFKDRGQAPPSDLFSASNALNQPKCPLLMPLLSPLWAACEGKPKLKNVAKVTIGFYFYAETDPDYPLSEVQVSPTQRPDFYQGFRLAEGTPETHLLPKLEWLNQKPIIIRRKCGGTKRGTARLIMNHVRTGGDAWRHKAFIDHEGRPATDAFLLLTPTNPYWSLESLWALCNSPIANAYTLTHSTVKQIGVRLLQNLPVPDLKSKPTALTNAVKAYFEMASAFNKDLDEVNTSIKAKSKTVGKRGNKEDSAPTFPAMMEGSLANRRASALDSLRALHWRVDAEVLRLYAFQPEVERQLLDFFANIKRIGVPFEQNEYIPADFQEVQRLDDYLRVTDEWESTDARRCQLIETRIKSGQRSAMEECEFKELQRLFYLHRQFYIRNPMIDENALRQLQDNDAVWIRQQ